jgi:hypothetical protein
MKFFQEIKYFLLRDINLKLIFTSSNNVYWCEELDSDIFLTLKKGESCIIEVYENWRLNIYYRGDIFHIYHMNEDKFEKMFIGVAESREERINKIIN